MSVIQESLEKLQNVMTATNLNQVIERVASACQKLRLKFSGQVCLFIGDDRIITAVHDRYRPVGLCTRGL